jgi:hypothetical protein
MYLLASNNTISKFPYTLEELRSDNPRTSFPAILSEEELAVWGVFNVDEQGPPTFNEATESIEIGAPTYLDGKWVAEWIVTPAGTEEVERRTAAQAHLIRTERNSVLAFTDYSQLPDYPGSTEDKVAFTQFRQALREVPQQSDFPWNVVWPSLDLGV